MTWMIGVWLATAWAHSDGSVTGRASTGCTACHGAGADSTTRVTLSVPSLTVAPGELVPVTVTVSTTNSNRTAGGLDVHAAQGTFTAGAGTQVVAGEITHTAPRVMSSGSASWTFDWRAPTAEARYTLTAAGNAVNQNNLNTGDGWNLAAALSIFVDDPCDDVDRDTFTTCADDCDDRDADVHPGATERCDEVDNNCDGTVDEDSAADAPLWFVDSDLDTWGAGAGAPSCDALPGRVLVDGDCADADGAVNPGAAEIWYDGVDQDCDGGDDFDADRDGQRAVASGGPDCDDTAPFVFAGASDAWYDGVDADCAGDDDFDADTDGFASSSFGGSDCDDANATRFPGAPDPAGDGVVTDCDLASADDQDLDGFQRTGAGGTDCDDANSGVFPGATDTPYDGIDADCSGGSDFDLDADGHDRVENGGDDCDDTVAVVHPGVPELWYDGVDQDCDGNDDDQDNDGVALASDCDDTDPARAPDCTTDTGGDTDEPGDTDLADTDLADTDEAADDTDEAFYPTDDDIRPCGCASTGGATGLVWVTGLAGVALLRRRRKA